MSKPKAILALVYCSSKSISQNYVFWGKNSYNMFILIWSKALLANLLNLSEKIMCLLKIFLIKLSDN